MYLYPMDIFYLVLVVPALILAVYAQAKVQGAYNKYSKVYSQSGYTGRDIARKALDENGLDYIKIEQIGGNLTDHYDPKNEVIRLSESIYNSSSVAALGIALHEAGHAIQRKVNYTPIKIRNSILPAVQFSSYAAIPIALIGFYFGNFLLTFGIILFSLTVLFQLITLPVEFDASKRALSVLSDNGILYGEDLKGAENMLKAAAFTYVASALVAIMNLLRLILLSRNRRN